jgi:hypothetical protein
MLLVCRARQKTELHHESQYGRENNCKRRPGSSRAKTLHQGFRQYKKKIGRKHKQKTVSYEDAGSGRRTREYMLKMKGRKERANAEVKNEETKLEYSEDRFFHRWALVMSLARWLDFKEKFRRLMLQMELHGETPPSATTSWVLPLKSLGCTVIFNKGVYPSFDRCTPMVRRLHLGELIC